MLIDLNDKFAVVAYGGNVAVGRKAEHPVKLKGKSGCYLVQTGNEMEPLQDFIKMKRQVLAGPNKGNYGNGFQVIEITPRLLETRLEVLALRK